MMVSVIGKDRPRVVLGFVLLILLSATPAVCETIYRWKNDAGEFFFSNVSPPVEGSAYQIINMGRDEGCEIAPITDLPAGLRPLETPATIACSPDESPPVLLMRVLNERITRRKNEIGAMEQLLKKQASDEGLRRSLMRKKRYLAEELMYLAELK